MNDVLISGSKPYTVYMLRSVDGSFYVGVTTDMARRLDEHNGLRKGGAKATRMRRPLEVVYTEVYPSRSEAQVREYALKRLSHKEKLQLCVMHRGDTLGVHA